MSYGQPVAPKTPGPASASGASGAESVSARQSTLRESNLALVARTVFSSDEPLSRADVAVRTSMTRSTVSRLVDDLVGGGVLAELDRAAVSGRGRPSTPLAAGAGIAALGLQVNVTYVAARVINLRGTVVAEGIEPGDFHGCRPELAMTRLERLSEEVLAEVPAGTVLAGAGLAIPGIVSAGTGHLLLAPNLGWADIYPAQLMSRTATAGLPLRVGNEADLAAVSVAQLRPGRLGPMSDFIYVSGEMGIGAAAVVGGAVMAGRHGWAGEIGHVCVDPDGPPCACGSTGCLEQYAGRGAILKAAAVPPGLGLEELAQQALGGHFRAKKAIARAAWALGIALSGVVNVLDIPAVVLGGDLGLIAELLTPDLERQLSSRTLSARWIPPTIATARRDLAPGSTGAALGELETVLNHPAPWLSETDAPT
jgi:predicted NBD/HSP70 family sugar kinase